MLIMPTTLTATSMSTAEQRLRLMQLASSNLPIGGYSWSQGLEWAVEAGWVPDVAAFERWRIALPEMALSLGYSWIESAVMAGVKLVPFGQQAAQQLILRLCDHYATEMPRALAAPDGDIGSATPLAAIASARHETQYSRLFRS